MKISDLKIGCAVEVKSGTQMTFSELTSGHSDVLKYFKEFKTAFEQSDDPRQDAHVMKAYNSMEQAVTLIAYDLGIKVRR